MRSILLAAFVLSAQQVNVAQGTTLIGQQIVFRFDSQGLPLETAVVGSGPEFAGFPSPTGRAWQWTVDFGADSFTITAESTEVIHKGSLSPGISFASVMPGLIPADPGKTKLIETSVNPSLDISSFEGPDAVIVGSGTGIELSFEGLSDSDPIPKGTTVRWAGTIELGETARVIPLPATVLLLLTGVAGLAAAARRS